MRSGVCVGAVLANGCQYRGWSPHWLPPRADWDAVVARLLNDPDEIVCPYCLIDRARTARLAGFNAQKAARLRAMLDGWWCLSVDGSRSTGHTHLVRFADEDLSRARAEPPVAGERDSG